MEGVLITNGKDMITSFSEFQNITGSTEIETVNKKLDCIFAALTEKKDKNEADKEHKSMEDSIIEKIDTLKVSIKRLSNRVYYISGFFGAVVTLVGVLVKVGMV